MDEINNFDKEFGKALRSYGYDFPITEDEIKLFEENINEEHLSFGELLEDPSVILSRKEAKQINFSSSLQIDPSAVHNLARAAREGKSLSPSVKKKMEEARKRAEEEDNNE